MTTLKANNTTAVQFKKNDIVVAKGPTKNAKKGIITGIVPPFGTDGEWTYAVYWYAIGDDGCGWRDCDLELA